eukprot:scaffold3772_cov180-Pinguiococcus_pyrenoidosus.AAC.1
MRQPQSPIGLLSPNICFVGEGFPLRSADGERSVPDTSQSPEATPQREESGRKQNLACFRCDGLLRRVGKPVITPRLLFRRHRALLRDRERKWIEKKMERMPPPTFRKTYASNADEMPGLTGPTPSRRRVLSPAKPS